MPHLVDRVRADDVGRGLPSRRVGGLALSMGSRPLPPVVVVHVDDLELGAVLDALLARGPSQRKVHLRRSHVVVVGCGLDNLGKR